MLQDLGEPGANADYMAASLRDALLPSRRWLALLPPMLLRFCERAYRTIMQSPVFGCPGIVNFVDARTQWFDAQVGGCVLSCYMRCELCERTAPVVGCAGGWL